MAKLNTYHKLGAAGSLRGINALQRVTRTGEKSVEYLEGEKLYTDHKPRRRAYPRKRTTNYGIAYSYMMDLGDFVKLKRKRGNRNMSYFLLLIDTLSKKIYTAALKRKTPQMVLQAFKAFPLPHLPLKLTLDWGREYASVFQHYCKKNNIILIQGNAIGHAYEAERAIRTIKSYLFKVMTLNKNFNWVDYLHLATKSYNSTYHRSIKMVPNDVTQAHEDKLIKLLKRPPTATHRYPVGATVRVALPYTTFTKGYKKTFDDTEYKISSHVKASVPMYMLEDDSGPLKRRFYEHELARVR